MRLNSAVRLSVIVAAVAGLGMATSAQAGDVRWANDVAGNWSVGDNWYGWGGGAHVPDTTAMIQQGIVTLDGAAVVGAVDLGSSYGAPGGANAGALHITTGGALTVTTYAFTVGVTSGFSSSVVQDGGAVTLQSGDNNLTVGKDGVGTYTMSGGTINATSYRAGAYNPWWGGIQVGGNATGQGTFKQAGGTVSLDQTYLNLNGSATGHTGLYEITGGTLTGDTAGYPAVKFDGLGTFRVKGSQAVITTPNGGGFTDNAPVGAKGIAEFRLDNSANHISAMTSLSGGFARQANLKASLDGGVLLAGASQFTLVRAKGGYASWAGNWLSQPTGTTGLWDTATVWENSVCDTNISLAAVNNKGTLDATGTLGASFAASHYGFVNLANVSTSQPLALLVDVTGGTLSNFTSALDGAGISWATTATPGYNLQLVLDPAVSGASNFAWDFGTVDAGMSIDKVSLVAVPEPATLALLGAMSLVGLSMRKRSETR